MQFSAPDKINKLSTADIADIVAAVTHERATTNSRNERVAVRVSNETLDAFHTVADKLGMRSVTADRVLLPDVLQFALLAAVDLLDTE